MNYPDGQLVRLGDKVRLGNNKIGIVVCSIDTSEYSTLYPMEDWSYLGSGVIINFMQFGLIHYENPDPDLELVERE